MSPRFVGTLLFIIVFACMLTGVLVYPNLPDVFISHWGVSGQANGSMSKFWGTFLLPTMMFVFIGLWALLPKIDPIAPGFKSFRYVYDFFWFLIISFLAYVYALTLGVNLGWQLNMTKALLPALAALIASLGILMPYLKRNWFIGIRTPWTISNDRVWEKTHKLGGNLFVASGAIIFLSTFLNSRLSVWLILVPLLGTTLISVVYSYLLFKREELMT